jgi:hypothetical protein
VDWFKKHTDAIIVLTAVISCNFWMNGRLSDLRADIARLDRDIIVIKTVLLLKNIYPQELVKSDGE